MKENNTFTTQIEKLVTSILDSKVKRIEPIERDVGDSQIFLITMGSGEFFLKTGNQRQNYDVEHRVLEILREKEVKVPKPIAASTDTNKYGFTFSLQEKIPGRSMYRVEKELWPRLLNEVGEQMSLVYDIRMPGFGPIDTGVFRKNGKVVGSRESWFEYIEQNFIKRFEEIVKKVKEESLKNFEDTNLNRDQLKKLLEIVERREEIKEKTKFTKDDHPEFFSLIHGDLHFDHFIIKNGRLSGIIDFNKTYIGDPTYDIAYFSVMPHGSLYKELIKGGNIHINYKVFKKYRLLVATRKIHTRYIRHDYLHDYPKILDVVINELNQ